MKRHRRLQFLSAAFLAVLAAPPLGAQPAATSARIKIDPDLPIHKAVPREHAVG